MYKKYTFRLWESIGFVSLFIYMSLTYIPQIFFHQVFFNNFKLLYNGTQNPFIFVVLTFCLFLFIITVLDKVYPKISIRIKQNNLKILGKVFTWSMIFFLLLSSIYFYKNFGLNFRQTKSLSDGGVIIQVLWFLRFAGEFYIFYILASFLNGKKIKFSTKIKILLIVISWLLTLTGSLQLPFIFIGFFLVFSSEKRLKSTFFKKFQKKKSILKIVIIIIILFLIFIAAVFIGFANKIGYDKALAMFTDMSLLNNIISHVALRLSTSYVSVLFMVDDHLFDIDLQIETYTDALHTFLARISSIVPIFEYKLNGFESVNRTNYLLLFIPNFHERAGASPGILASIYYLPTFPFNFILMGSYTLLVIRAINKFISINAKNITLFGKLIIVYLVYPLFESPLNMLSIVEPAFFYFLLFIIMSYFSPSLSKQITR